MTHPEGNAAAADQITEAFWLLLRSVIELRHIVVEGMTADHDYMCDALKRARQSIDAAEACKVPFPFTKCSYRGTGDKPARCSHPTCDCIWTLCGVCEVEPATHELESTDYTGPICGVCHPRETGRQVLVKDDPR
jgi:hypothetical protein